jgi:hypothetical protein
VAEFLSGKAALDDPERFESSSEALVKRNAEGAKFLGG